MNRSFPPTHRFLLVAAVTLLLAGCGPRVYEWGWYILNPLSPQGGVNAMFLIGGVGATVGVSVAAFVISVLIGGTIAVFGISRSRILRGINRGYVEGVRAIPLLVMILWVYYGLPVILGIKLGILAAGILSLALSDSAFEAEVFRAGIQSVPKGQTEAAASLGLRPMHILRYVILPQAIRKVLPALGNQFIYVLKMSSLLSVIGYPELTRRANELTVTEYRPLEIYTFLVVEYLILVLAASALVRWMERRLGAAS
jgi:glutamine transport system permease protein